MPTIPISSIPSTQPHAEHSYPQTHSQTLTPLLLMPDTGIDGIMFGVMGLIAQ
jgi:hypothetical protein